MTNKSSPQTNNAPEYHTKDDPHPVPELTTAEREAAEKEGVKQAYAESALTNFRTRSATESYESQADRWPDRHEIMPWAGLVDLGLDAFKEAIAEDAKDPIPESKVAGLVEIERSGKNRTEYVKALCDRLGVASPLEVTHAGPGFTNDVTAVNTLVRDQPK